MSENLLRSLVSACLAVHGVPLVTLNFVVFAAWAIEYGADGVTSPVLVLSVGILLMFAFHFALIALGS
jgi:hypothetical protein